MNYNSLKLSKIIENYPGVISRSEIVKGKTGDIVITDNRGVHQGSVLKNGYRLQLGLGLASLYDENINTTTHYVKRKSSSIWS